MKVNAGILQRWVVFMRFLFLWLLSFLHVELVDHYIHYLRWLSLKRSCHGTVFHENLAFSRLIKYETRITNPAKSNKRVRQIFFLVSVKVSIISFIFVCFRQWTKLKVLSTNHIFNGLITMLITRLLLCVVLYFWINKIISSIFQCSQEFWIQNWFES